MRFSTEDQAIRDRLKSGLQRPTLPLAGMPECQTGHPEKGTQRAPKDTPSGQHLIQQ
jgi:hypothetical protein